jgi:subtilisin family serine protease
MLKLLICKNVEPGVPEDGHFILRTIDCIRYARERGAQVINCSWGRMLNDSRGISERNLEGLKNALDNTYEFTPIVAVAAAGNLHKGQPQEEGNRDNPANQYYPANFNLDNVIAVAFSTKDGSLAKRSCYGKQSIHLTAPGVAIISASCSGDRIYRVLSGTSMAAPYVTGSIALMMAKFLHAYSCEKLVDHLCEKANKSNLEDLQVREGRLDLVKALEFPQSPSTRLEVEFTAIKQGAEHGIMPQKLPPSATALSAPAAASEN